MPAGLVEHEHRLDVRFQAPGEAVQEQAHGGGGDGRHDQREVGAAGRADGGVEVDRGEALVAQPGGTLPALPPAMRGAALLADARFVLEPELEAPPRVRGRRSLQRFAQPLFWKAAWALASDCG